MFPWQSRNRRINSSIAASVEGISARNSQTSRGVVLHFIADLHTEKKKIVRRLIPVRMKLAGNLLNRRAQRVSPVEDRGLYQRINPGPPPAARRGFDYAVAIEKEPVAARYPDILSL
jgi:hypothetical protein